VRVKGLSGVGGKGALGAGTTRIMRATAALRGSIKILEIDKELGASTYGLEEKRLYEEGLRGCGEEHEQGEGQLTLET